MFFFLGCIELLSSLGIQNHGTALLLLVSEEGEALEQEQNKFHRNANGSAGKRKGLS